MRDAAGPHRRVRGTVGREPARGGDASVAASTTGATKFEHCSAATYALQAGTQYAITVHYEAPTFAGADPVTGEAVLEPTERQLVLDAEPTSLSRRGLGTAPVVRRRAAARGAAASRRLRPARRQGGPGRSDQRAQVPGIISIALAIQCIKNKITIYTNMKISIVCKKIAIRHECFRVR